MFDFDEEAIYKIGYSIKKLYCFGNIERKMIVSSIKWVKMKLPFMDVQ